MCDKLDKPGRPVSLKEARDIAPDVMKEAEQQRADAREKEVELEEEKPPAPILWWCPRCKRTEEPILADVYGVFFCLSCGKTLIQGTFVPKESC